MPYKCWSLYETNGEWTGLQMVEWELTAGAAGDATGFSAYPIGGQVIRVELESSDTVPNAATVKVYEEDSRCAIGARHDAVAYVHAGPAVITAQILPTIQRTDIAGNVIAGEYAPPVVQGTLTCAIAGFTAGQHLHARAYIR